jgi:23S rRNA (adenine2503-C2)-methyltransferase
MVFSWLVFAASKIGTQKAKKDRIKNMDFLAMTETELGAWAKEQALPAFRGRQIFARLQSGVDDWQKMTELPKDLREKLAQEHDISLPRLIKAQVSKSDDTAKLLYELNDGTLLETVVMSYEREKSRDRATVCISTQAGCAMGCKFCATGLYGLERNLLAGEIIAQVIGADLWLKQKGGAISNVVYMGMGEPLQNLPAVLKSIEILNSESGLNIGQRRMTVSTCGIVPKMKALADCKLQIGLAVSLHAADDETRNKLMPVNKRYPLAELFSACDYYTEKTGRRITYEYALLKDINDQKEDALKLAALLKGRLSHVNLIPVNEVKETGFAPSLAKSVEEFAEVLRLKHIEVTVRERRGADIDAACGQLRKRSLEEKANTEV